MFVFGDLIVAIANILDYLLGLYKWILLIAVLLSWVNPDPYNPIVRFLHAVTEPVLRPVRRLIGFTFGPIDISPIIVFLIIMFIQSFFIRTLVKLGYKLGGG
ncbi:MAG: YggT family protein [Dissulfurispiraceae bacterium]|jgi:YggT family protein